MDAPTCRLCGAKHWPREDHVFGKKKEKAPKVEEPPAAREERRSSAALLMEVEKGEGLCPHCGKPVRVRDSKRRAYMRRYMQERRLKADRKKSSEAIAETTKTFREAIKRLADG